MMASFILSVTLVPVLAAYLFRGGKHGAPHAQGGRFERLQERYSGFAKWLVGRRRLVLAVYCLVCIPAFLLARHIGTELFPRVDTGQFQLRVRAPDGMRLEDTERIVREVDQLIRDDVGGDSVEITLANIGNTPWEYPVNGIFVWNSGPHEAILLVALKGGRRPAVRDIEESIRAKLAQKFPDVRFSFEAGDIVSQVLNFGAPAPISVTVSGNKLSETRRYTERMAAELEKIGSLRDVQIPQALDYPTLDVTIDRERAGQLGVTVDRVGKSIVAATSSSVLVTPNFWTDPASGIPYRVALRVPESDAVRNPARRIGPKVRCNEHARGRCRYDGLPHAVDRNAELPCTLSIDRDVESRIVERLRNLNVAERSDLLELGSHPLRVSSGLRKFVPRDGNADGRGGTEVQHLGYDVPGFEREPHVRELLRQLGTNRLLYVPDGWSPPALERNE